MHWCEVDRAPEEDRGRKAESLLWSGKSATSVVLLVIVWQAGQSVSWEESFTLVKLYLTV